MTVLVSGASGLIGGALLPVLTQAGYDVAALVRRHPVAGVRGVSWDPEQGKIDEAAFKYVQAVVHLAGESIIGRWTPAKKARILESRVKSTRLLAQTVARLPKPPDVFICASATGFYGDRGDELLNEESASGQGFLAEVCKAWEAAAAPAAQAGIRTVFLRTGIVLSRRGGALAKMLLPFQWGLGSRLGDGKQFWSWIALEDEVEAILHALLHEKVNGPVNLAAPAPVTNAEFTRVLASVLSRPALAPPVPRFAPRLILGEMADALLFSSQRVMPRRLQSTGYRFRFPELSQALRFVLSCQQARD